MPELPDVPEAAREAVFRVLRQQARDLSLMECNVIARWACEAALPVLIEQGWADPTEVQRLTGLIGMHDPTGQDHMEEMWEHAQRADAAEARVMELEAVLVEQGWTPPEVTKQLIRERDQAQASERLGNAALERLIHALDHAKAQNWICTHGSCHAPAVTGEGVDARCEEHRDVEQGWTPPGEDARQ